MILMMYLAQLMYRLTDNGHFERDVSLFLSSNEKHTDVHYVHTYTKNITLLARSLHVPQNHSQKHTGNFNALNARNIFLRFCCVASSTTKNPEFILSSPHISPGAHQATLEHLICDETNIKFAGPQTFSFLT